VVTNADGTFRINSVIPGVEFELIYHRSGSNPQGSNSLTGKLTVRPGEMLSLGDVRVKRLPQDGED
jgi:hypothetical protein